MVSIVFLGFSLITLAILYGVSFMLTPMILGSVFTNMNAELVISNADWLSMYQTNEDTAQYLVPLIPTFAIFVLVIKVILVASAHGRE